MDSFKASCRQWVKNLIPGALHPLARAAGRRIARAFRHARHCPFLRRAQFRRVLFVTLFNPGNIGVRCLAAQCKARGHDVHILQVKQLASARMFPPPEEIGWYHYMQGYVHTDYLSPEITAVERRLMVQAIRDWQPDIIGFSGMSTEDALWPELSALLREAEPKAFIAAGGPGPMLSPELYLRNGADVVIRGEAENSILELVDACATKAGWGAVPNACYLENNTMICNPMAPVPVDLDSYPMPTLEDNYFSYIDNNSYVAEANLMDKNIYLIMGSRGCIGRCTYCSAPRMRKLYGKMAHLGIRNRSTASLLEECRWAKNNGVKGIHFADDFFIRPAEELLSFFKEYKRDIGLHFTMYFHPQQLLEHPEIIDAAVSAGLRSTAFGLQHAGDSFCRKIFHRRRFSNDYPTLVRLLQCHDVPVNFHLIEGVPQETENDFTENLNFVAQFPLPPSRKPGVQFDIMLLNYIKGSALLEENPGIESVPRSTQEWAYRCLLLELRQMTDDARFASIRVNEEYRKDIVKLWKLRNNIDNERHFAYLREEAERLRGKEVYFWGGGWVYQAQRHLFAGSRPKAVLVDSRFKAPDTIDGIPVLRTEHVLAAHEDIPVIMFINRKWIQKLLREWRHNYPWVKDIVTCTELL